MRRVFCNLPWAKIKVQPNGYVSNCCFQKPIGNLLETPFEEIWTGELQKEIRRITLDNQLHSYCQATNCPFMFMDLEKNAIIPDRQWPKEMEIDMPNTWCNIGGPIPTKNNPACIMCPRHRKDFKPDEQNLFNKVLDVLKPLVPYLQRLMIVGLGEIFWKNNLWDILDKMGYEQHKYNIQFSSFSNGIMFDEEKQSKFIKSCPWSDLSISIDAASAETFRKIRRYENAYDKIIKNVIDYVNHPKRDRQHQWIAVCYNINLINIHEVEEMVSMWQGIPVHRVMFSPTHKFHGGYKEELDSIVVNEKNYKKFVEAKEKICETSEKTGIRVDIWNALEMNYPKEAKEKLYQIKLS